MRNVLLSGSDAQKLKALLDNISLSGYEVSYYRGECFGDPRFAEALEEAIKLLDSAIEDSLPPDTSTTTNSYSDWD